MRQKTKPLLGFQNLEIQDMQALVEVSRHNSFSKAAEKLNKSQSAVSQQIAKLENSLGVILIDRDERNKLTEEGEVLYKYSTKILQIYQEALNYFLEPELSGDIRFGLPEDFATVFLSDILIEINSKYPNVHMNVECDLTLNLLKRFHKKHFDLVLVKTTSLDDFPLENEIDIWDEKLVWVSKKNTNITVCKESIPLVLSPKPCLYRKRALESLDENNFKYNIVYTSTSFIGSCAAVKADMGITVLPKNMIPDGLVEFKSKLLPDLKDTHISFLIKENAPSFVKWFANYVLGQLKEEIH